MSDPILSFITAFAVVYFAIPSIIHVARVKHLMDEPNDRGSHVERTPTLGGVAIFAGVLFSLVLWTPFEVFGDLQYILCAFVILFLIGVKDDLDPMSPWKKLIGQLLAATILVFKANVLMTGLHGVFGIGGLPELISIPLSIFTILVIINAFNLIDGINGLSGSIAVLISVTLGVWFYANDRMDLTILALSMAGATIAFLKYNFTPARIFMGDTGSLFLGTVSAILIITFIELQGTMTEGRWLFQSAPAVAIGILILPLFDTLRVFTIRLLRGRSPFKPDRNHLHHLLIDFGYSHMQATGILVLVNLGFMGLVVWLDRLGTVPLILVILGVAALLSNWLHLAVRRRRLSGKGVPVSVLANAIQEKEEVHELV